MQHLDEGTIHSWLDGALSADEAARVEAHVAECPQCATAVAEARGFIAASSRILTALDHVPRGVVPAAHPVKWYNRSAWRAAAAVLVVAVGSLVVVRNSDRNNVPSAAIMDSAGVAEATVAPRQIAAASPGATAMSKPQAPSPVIPPKRSATVSEVASPAKVVMKERARDEAVDAASGGNAAAAAAPQMAGPVIAAPQSNLSGRVAGVVVRDMAASEQPPLKVVGHPRLIGASVTLYEVAPGDTVTFTEPSNVQLNSIVTTGLSSAEPQMRRSAAKSAPTVPPQVASQSPPAPPLRVDVTNGVTTISWPDVTTGNMLTLSGHMPAERLKEIKLRIERERAAAATKKKP
jgi:LysM repeat protein